MKTVIVSVNEEIGNHKMTSAESLQERKRTSKTNCNVVAEITSITYYGRVVQKSGQFPFQRWAIRIYMGFNLGPTHVVTERGKLD